MNKVFASKFATVLALFLIQISAYSEIEESHPLPTGTTIAAMLDRWVDARKSKIGDEVTAQTTEPVKEDGEVDAVGHQLLHHFPGARSAAAMQQHALFTLGRGEVDVLDRGRGAFHSDY